MASSGWIDGSGRSMPIFRMRNGQVVAYTGTAGVIGNAISSDCKLVMFWATTDAYVRIAANAADADATDIPVPAGVVFYHPVEGSTIKLAAKQVTTGGSLHVAECY
jgi:hypothetical protein